MRCACVGVCVCVCVCVRVCVCVWCPLCSMLFDAFINIPVRVWKLERIHYLFSSLSLSFSLFLFYYYLMSFDDAAKMNYWNLGQFFFLSFFLFPFFLAHNCTKLLNYIMMSCLIFTRSCLTLLRDLTLQFFLIYLQEEHRRRRGENKTPLTRTG